MAISRLELENAIKNGESVWFVDNCNEKVWEIDLNEKYKPEIYLDEVLYVYKNINDRFQLELFIKGIFKTKAEAEHYLHHANVSRVEQLPFLTWEEFLKEREISFKDYEGYCVYLLFSKSDKSINLFCLNLKHQNQYYEATEQNFYKAYDECVRLFKGE